MTTEPLTAARDGTALHQLLADLIEGVILLDDRGAIVWANRAALAMHGVDSLAALGSSGQQYSKRFTLYARNGKALEPASFPLNRVLAGESFSDQLVEVAPKGDTDQRWVHKVRGLQLHDADGEIGHVALVLQDLSEWASAEERFEKTFDANPAPALICRRSDLRFIKVNHGFLDMTGFKRDQVIGRSAYELDVFENAAHRSMTIRHLCEGSVIPQTESMLRLADGSIRHIIVAGQPLDICEEGCMLLTFIDLNPTKKAEEALRQSEERFQKAFRMAPVASAVASADDFTLLDVNDAFVALLGHARADLQDRPVEALALWPEQDQRQIAAQLEATDSIRNMELRVSTRQDTRLDCLFSAEAVEINDRPCVLLTLLDISERKRSESELFEAIETVMQDASWFSQTLLEKLANVRSTKASSAGAELDALTKRERDVFALIYQGLSDKEIAKQLDLAPNTVRNYVSAIYGKLNVHSRGEAIVWARERGLRP